jgi:hypothetical protein
MVLKLFLSAVRTLAYTGFKKGKDLFIMIN